MARPKALTDEAALDAVMDLMRRDGPEGVTFAAAAKQTGLSGASLVQRFGSKPAMVQAALLRAWDQLDTRTAELDGTLPATPVGAIQLLVELSRDYGGGDAYAEGLVVLREDLRDPLLRQRGVAWGAALTAAVGRRLNTDPDTAEALGRMMTAQWQGVVLWWGFTRGQPVEAAVNEALAAWCRAMRLET